MSNFGGTGYRVEWKDGALEYSRGPSIYHAAVQQKELTRQDWDRFWDALKTDGVRIWDWKGSYVNPSVLDGTEWDLELHAGQYKKRIYGCNAYPGWGEPDWSKSREFACFLSAIGLLIGEPDYFVG